jgi:hypothetical protein
LEALIRKTYFCGAAERQLPADIKLFDDNMFFIKEAAFKRIYDAGLTRFASSLRTVTPDWARVDQTAGDMITSETQALLDKLSTSLQRETLALSAVKESNLILSIPPTSLQTFEDILSQETLKETLLGVPGIEELVKGHQNTFVLQLWNPNDRTVPVREETITTNIFGEGHIVLKDLRAGTYDFTLKTPRTLRKALKSIITNRASLHLDFTEGRGSDQSAYLRIGDLNDDGEINARDFVTASKLIKGTSGAEVNVSLAAFDLNEDGRITLQDYVYLIRNWGKNE